MLHLTAAVARRGCAAGAWSIPRERGEGGGFEHHPAAVCFTTRKEKKETHI